MSVGDIVDSYIDMESMEKRAKLFHQKHRTPLNQQRVLNGLEDDDLKVDDLRQDIKTKFDYNNRIKQILRSVPDDDDLRYSCMKRSSTDLKLEDRQGIGGSMTTYL